VPTVTATNRSRWLDQRRESSGGVRLPLIAQL
jgi:hypothetical protein